MAYERPITIKEAIDNIQKGHYVLPSIQREFVWDTEQIETLFDSLMRDYPIGTFLFWKVDKTKIKDFQFYEFLKKYHEKDFRHNQKADLPDSEGIIALLDGQQRMTSLYIALAGSYAEKRPYARKDDRNAYPSKKLYLNLLHSAERPEAEYEFKFLTQEEVKSSESKYWFECRKIFELNDMSKVSVFLMKNKLMDTSIYSEKQSEFAINTLNEFFNIIHQKGTISYYLEKGEELDKVLQIFIRINSGGTKLSYSDLLLSIATAQWSEKDAREVIHDFVDEINKVGDGFNFNKDLVLKSCLVLSDLDVKFNVDNFNKENMKTIEDGWDKISDALLSAVELIAKFGYNQTNLIATNAIIPIAYFIYKNECEKKIVHHTEWVGSRKAIKEWLARVLLKGTFGGQPDSIYPTMRELIKENMGRFPLEKIIEKYRGKRKSISFVPDEIENLLDLQYGKAKTYCALSLLYPALNHNYRYHQDHIHPKSKFAKRDMKAADFSDEDIKEYNEQVNSISNLQLLQATENMEKSDIALSDWIKEEFPIAKEREAYLTQHHIKSEQSLDFDDFMSFVKVRRKTLKKLFKKILILPKSKSLAETGK